ncbi:hypothetical protein GCM10007919_21120 [Rhizobium indigoferae]|nr:hypothetical protein GCM10007919_21120 [Rhizobium indigoferae]
MHRVGVINWSGSEDFAPLTLVMSDREKHTIVRSLRDVAEVVIVGRSTRHTHDEKAARAKTLWPEVSIHHGEELQVRENGPLIINDGEMLAAALDGLALAYTFESQVAVHK